MEVIVILIFVVLLALPGFYWITRRVFPHRSKRLAMRVAIALTAAVVAALVLATVGH